VKAEEKRELLKKFSLFCWRREESIGKGLGEFMEISD